MPPRPDLDRVGFVTRAYPHMRDAIRGIPLGPVLIAMFRGMRQEDLLTFGIAVFALFPLAHVTAHVFEPRLDRRFGKVVKPDGNDDLLKGWIFAVAVVVLLELDDWALSAGAPSILILALAGAGLWVSIRDWPFRCHTIIFPIVCGAASTLLGSTRAEGASLLQQRMMADAAAMIAWMLVGCLDLLTLRRVMPRTEGVRGRSGT